MLPLPKGGKSGDVFSVVQTRNCSRLCKHGLTNECPACAIISDKSPLSAKSRMYISSNARSHAADALRESAPHAAQQLRGAAGMKHVVIPQPGPAPATPDRALSLTQLPADVWKGVGAVRARTKTHDAELPFSVRLKVADESALQKMPSRLRQMQHRCQSAPASQVQEQQLRQQPGCFVRADQHTIVRLLDELETGAPATEAAKYNFPQRAALRFDDTFRRLLLLHKQQASAFRLQHDRGSRSTSRASSRSGLIATPPLGKHTRADIIGRNTRHPTAIDIRFSAAPVGSALSPTAGVADAARAVTQGARPMSAVHTRSHAQRLQRGIGSGTAQCSSPSRKRPETAHISKDRKTTVDKVAESWSRFGLSGGEKRGANLLVQGSRPGSSLSHSSSLPDPALEISRLHTHNSQSDTRDERGDPPRRRPHTALASEQPTTCGILTVSRMPPSMHSRPRSATYVQRSSLSDASSKPNDQSQNGRTAPIRLRLVPPSPQVVGDDDDGLTDVGGEIIGLTQPAKTQTITISENGLNGLISENPDNLSSTSNAAVGMTTVSSVEPGREPCEGPGPKGQASPEADSDGVSVEPSGLLVLPTSVFQPDIPEPTPSLRQRSPTPTAFVKPTRPRECLSLDRDSDLE